MGLDSGVLGWIKAPGGWYADSLSMVGCQGTRGPGTILNSLYYALHLPLHLHRACGENMEAAGR